MAAERRFRAMGSDAHVIVAGTGAEHLIEHAVRRIEELESRWSRFRETSEVSELTRCAGRPVAVSDDTRLLVERAVEAWRLSGGAFDPTVLGSMIRAGYAHDFEQGARRPRGTLLHSLVGCSDIVISGRQVTLPEHTGFDPGGIGKGLATDLVVEELMRAGAEGVCVNLGGDLRVEGRPPDQATWTIAIERPGEVEPVAVIGVAAGAVASSTTLLRRWNIEGREAHHLIDPVTGEPSESDLVFSCVVTGAAWRAEVMAKVALLRGSARAFDLFDERYEGLVADADGAILRTPGLARFLLLPRSTERLTRLG